MKIKICGITSSQDAQLALRAGADVLGLIFTSVSPRCISISQAQDIIKNISPFAVITGVFQDQDISEIMNIINSTGIQVIQLHGKEDLEYIKELRQYTQLPVIKAYRQPQKAEINILKDLERNKLIQGMLIDKESPEYNYKNIHNLIDLPIILAGGINSTNIKDIINNNKFAYGVDLCSSVEESPGKKSPDKLQELFEKIQEQKNY